jgi:hypothetical protein
MTQDCRVVIEYTEDVAATPFQSAHVEGETLVVTDAATAAELHPKAKITRYVNGKEFHPSKDEGFVKYQQQVKEQKAAEREAAKAAKAEEAKHDEDMAAEAAKHADKSSKSRKPKRPATKPDDNADDAEVVETDAPTENDTAPTTGDDVEAPVEISVEPNQAG